MKQWDTSERCASPGSLLTAKKKRECNKVFEESFKLIFAELYYNVISCVSVAHSSKRLYYCRNVLKGPPGDSNAPFQGQGTHTLPHQHHYQKQHQQQHATLPRTSVIQDMNTQTQVSNLQCILIC
jgi:ABC-type nickel/cobalt efflux system permease component RcnA